jgi:hypothetical protein
VAGFAEFITPAVACNSPLFVRIVITHAATCATWITNVVDVPAAMAPAGVHRRPFLLIVGFGCTDQGRVVVHVLVGGADCVVTDRMIFRCEVILLELIIPQIGTQDLVAVSSDLSLHRFDGNIIAYSCLHVKNPCRVSRYRGLGRCQGLAVPSGMAHKGMQGAAWIARVSQNMKE